MDGVHIQAELTSETTDALRNPVRSRDPLSPRSPKTKRRQSLPDPDLSDDHVPTAHELAESFLAEEPEQEREELEAAFQSQSSYQSQGSSEDEDEPALGMGAAPSLPAFLERSITAALDRSEVIIRDINVRLDISISPQEKEFIPSISAPSPVTLHFHIERAAVDGLSSPETEVQLSSTESPGSNRKDGKRRMSLRNICAQIVGSPELFAASSQPSRSSSPLTSRSVTSSNAKDTSGPPSGTQSVRTTDSPFNSRHDIRSEISDMVESEARPWTESSQHLSNLAQPLEASTMTTDDDRFADAGSDDEAGPEAREEMKTSEENRAITVSRIGMDMTQNLHDPEFQDFPAEDSAFLEAALGDALLKSEIQHFAGASSKSAPTSAHDDLLGASLGDMYPQDFSLPASSVPSRPKSTELPTDLLVDLSSSHGSLHSSPNEPEPDCQPVMQSPGLAASAISTDSRHSNSSSSAGDLAESRLYGSEEARSIYESVYSDAVSNVGDQYHIPGGWDTGASSVGSRHETAPSDAIEQTIATSIISDLKAEVDDGCETPRPGSRATSQPSTDPPSAELRHYISTREPIGSGDNVQIPHTPSASDFPEENVSKPLLSVDQIGIWFPWPLFGREDMSSDTTDDSQDEPIEQSMFASSVFGSDTFHQDIPGAFSIYAERSASHRRKPSEVRADVKSPTKPSAAVSAQPATVKNKRTTGAEVEIGNVRVQIDVPLARLLFRLVQRLLEAFDSQDPSRKPPTTPASVSPPSVFAYKVSVTSFGLAWVESIISLSTSEGFSSRNHMLPDIVPPDTILQLRTRGINLGTSSAGDFLNLEVAVEKVALGLVDLDLISFDPVDRTRQSASNIRSGTSSDVRIQLRASKVKTEIDVATKLLKINFDAPRIDEAFTSFGGFSGMMELSNSIASASTIYVPPPPPASRPRGVHFAGAPPPTTSPSTSIPIKFNMHIYGVSVDVRSKSCALHLRTTTIRIIGRPQGIALTIGETRLSGPYIGYVDEMRAPFTVELMSTRLEFAFMPHEKHLAALLSLITPSNYRYEDDEDIIIDALLRQRRKGSVLEANVRELRVNVNDLNQAQLLSSMGDELSKLSTVAKYLPEDDRPGVLILCKVDQTHIHAVINEQIGVVDLSCVNSELAHVGLPVLLAVGVGSISLRRNQSETLLHDVIAAETHEIPMVMARMVGDEMDPTIKVKLYNLCVEYQVSTIMSLLGLSDEGTSEDVILGMAESVATITGVPISNNLQRQSTGSTSTSLGGPTKPAKPMRVDLLLRDCALGLSPRDAPSKALVVMSDTRFLGSLPNENSFSARLEVRKAQILLVDDVARLSLEVEPTTPSRRSFSTLGSRQVTDLCQQGFVSVSTTSTAVASIGATTKPDGTKILDVDFKNDLFLMETCADSTQTLIALLNGLAPPTPPSKDTKYQTKIMPVQDMMASFSGDGYMTNAGEFTEESTLLGDLGESQSFEDEILPDVDMVGSFYNPDGLPSEEDIDDIALEGDLEHIHPPPAHELRESNLLRSFHYQQDDTSSGELEFHDEYFGRDSEVKGTAHKWDSEKKEYDWRNQFKSDGSLKLRVRDMQIIWHLFDGYDWIKTRDAIAEAVDNVEQRAEERRQKRSVEDDDDGIQFEEDFLFNSVWITLPVNEEKGALAKKINHEIDDLVSETGSYATTTASRATTRTHKPRSRKRALRLERSRHHKISFELRGVNADVMIFPPDTGETQSSINLRVQDFEIYDHVPSSTWKKFATYMFEAGERQVDRPMIHLEILNVKPVPTLAASELVLRVIYSVNSVVALANLVSGNCSTSSSSRGSRRSRFHHSFL